MCCIITVINNAKFYRWIHSSTQIIVTHLCLLSSSTIDIRYYLPCSTVHFTRGSFIRDMLCYSTQGALQGRSIPYFWYIFKFITTYIYLHFHYSPPRWRRGSGLDCTSEDPGSIPGLPSPPVGPLMARRLKISSDVPVPCWVGLAR